MTSEFDYWRLKQVKKTSGLSTATIYRKMRLGEFPRSVPLSEGCVAWVSTEVEAWKQQRLQART